MFIVRFLSFHYTREFADFESALAHMKRACFDSVLETADGNILAEFSSICGMKTIKNG